MGMSGWLLALVVDCGSSCWLGWRCWLVVVVVIVGSGGW